MGNIKKIALSSIGMAGAGVGIAFFRDQGDYGNRSNVSNSFTKESESLTLKNNLDIAYQGHSDEISQENRRKFEEEDRLAEIAKQKKIEQLRQFQRSLDEEVLRLGLKKSDFVDYPDFVYYYENGYRLDPWNHLQKFRNLNCLDGKRKDCSWVIKKEENKRKLERAKKYFSWPLGTRDFEYREGSLDAINRLLKYRGVDNPEEFGGCPDFLDTNKYQNIRKVTEDYRKIKDRIEKIPIKSTASAQIIKCSFI